MDFFIAERILENLASDNFCPQTFVAALLV
jgi:hypothetical protein